MTACNHIKYDFDTGMATFALPPSMDRRSDYEIAQSATVWLLITTAEAAALVDAGARRGGGRSDA